MNSLNLSFLGQELKSSHSNKSFLLLNNVFRKNEKNWLPKYLIVCALTETEDHINPFQVHLPSPHHLKTSGFWYFLVIRKSDLKWVHHRKIFIYEMTKNVYQCRIQKWSHWYRSIVSKGLDIFKFWNFYIHSLAFSVRSPASKVQRPESSVQSPTSSVQRPECSVQRPEYSIQSPASSVQRLGSSDHGPELNVQSPASRVQVFRYAVKITDMKSTPIWILYHFWTCKPTDKLDQKPIWLFSVSYRSIFISGFV